MATKNELSPFEKEIRSFLDKPAGSLLYIAERALKGAILPAHSTSADAGKVS